MKKKILFVYAMLPCHTQPTVLERDESRLGVCDDDTSHTALFALGGNFDFIQMLPACFSETFKIWLMKGTLPTKTFSFYIELRVIQDFLRNILEKELLK